MNKWIDNRVNKKNGWEKEYIYYILKEREWKGKSTSDRASNEKHYNIYMTATMFLDMKNDK